MKPIIKLTIEGIDDAVIKDRFLNLSLTDYADLNNDDLTVTFDDRPKIVNGMWQYMKIPEHGAKATLKIGYAKGPNLRQPAPLTSMGSFTFNVHRTGKKKSQGHYLTLRFLALDLSKTMKQPRTGSFHRKTILEIIQEVAKRNTLEYKVQTDVGKLQIDHYDQINDPDMTFLSKLAKRNECVFKVIDGTIFFAKQGKLKEQAGIKGSTANIDATDCSEWEVEDQDRARYAYVTASFKNPDGGLPITKTFEVRNPDGSPAVLTGATASTSLTHSFGSEDEAQKAANAHGGTLSRSATKLTFKCIGHPLIRSEGNLHFIGDGLRPQVSKDWTVTKAKHEFAKNGAYTVEGEAEIPMEKTKKEPEGEGGGDAGGATE